MNISPMEALGRAHLRDVLTEATEAIEAVYEGSDPELVDEFWSEADANDARLGETLEALRGLLKALKATEGGAV